MKFIGIFDWINQIESHQLNKGINMTRSAEIQYEIWVKSNYHQLSKEIKKKN